VNKSTRRGFLESTLKIGAVSLALPALASADAPQPPQQVEPFELDELSISDLQDGMKSGKFTSRSLVEKYLGRIQQIDTQGPALNAVIALNPEARSIADTGDAESSAK